MRARALGWHPAGSTARLGDRARPCVGAAVLDYTARMPLGEPRMVNAQSVLTFGNPLPRDPARDDLLVAGLRGEFQSTVSRPMVTPGGPVVTAPLVLASNSARLTIAPGEAAFAVGFFGDYVTDLDSALTYVQRKTGTVRVALQNADVDVLVLGVLLTMQFSTGRDGVDEAIATVLEHHFGGTVDEHAVADAQTRIGVRVDNVFYVSMTVSNYETRTFQRAAPLGTSMISLRPWEGDVTDAGVQLTIDVNNRLEARQTTGNRILDGDRLDSIFDVLGTAARERSREIIETGHIDPAQFVPSGAR